LGRDRTISRPRGRKEKSRQRNRQQRRKIKAPSLRLKAAEFDKDRKQTLKKMNSLEQIGVTRHEMKTHTLEVTQGRRGNITRPDHTLQIHGRAYMGSSLA
jgi:hypothetical protein